MSIVYYRIAYDMDSESYEISYNLGNAYFRIGEYKQSLKYYLHAASLNNLDHQVFNNIGTVYLKLGDISNAAEYFLKSLKLEPAFMEANINFAKCVRMIFKVNDKFIPLSEDYNEEFLKGLKR